MKTAISIPNETYEKCEQLARKLGLSRSALYAKALDELVAKHATADQTEDPVTAKINAFWAKEGVENSALDAGFKRLRAGGIAASESDW